MYTKPVSLTSHKLATAPMMEYTDRHARYLFRLLSPNAWVYTEMVTAHALIHGDHNYLLDFHNNEHPIALQVGGSDPKLLALAAEYGCQWNYDEINLNVGCPSDRVQKGRFGACLMKEPNLVAECIDAMQTRSNKPITIKTRIGVDDLADLDFLNQFISINKEAGCRKFIIHARKAYLKGLSPKQNRTVPPIHYNRAYDIKRSHPELIIIVNGEITQTTSLEEHLSMLDGVMIGRAAYHNMYCLAQFENAIYNTPLPARSDIIEQYCSYILQQCEQAKPVPMYSMVRHVMGLYQGIPGARKFRHFISNNRWKSPADIKSLIDFTANLDDDLPH